MPVEIGPKCDIKDQAIEINTYQLISMYKKNLFKKKKFHRIFGKRSLITFKNF